MDEIIEIKSAFELKQYNDEEGCIKAYVTTYGNSDRVGDVIEQGALDNFIANFNGKLPMLLNHNSSQLPIGEWTEFSSDSTGVLGTGLIYTDTQLGRDTRTVIRRGLYDSVSIGFRVLDFEPIDGGRLFKQIELIEVSIVQRPANPQAVITDIKRHDGSVDVKLLEKSLRDVGLSRKEAKVASYSIDKNLRDAGVETTKQAILNEILKRGDLCPKK